MAAAQPFYLLASRRAMNPGNPPIEVVAGTRGGHDFLAAAIAAAEADERRPSAAVASQP
jgi:hypothetical protein